MNTTVIIVIICLIILYFIVMAILKHYAFEKITRKTLYTTRMLDNAAKRYPKSEHYKKWLDLNPTSLFIRVRTKFSQTTKKAELGESVRLLWIACESIQHLMKNERFIDYLISVGASSEDPIGVANDISDANDRMNILIDQINQSFFDIEKILDS